MWSYNSPVRVLFGNDGFASIAPLIDGRPYALVTYADAPFRALADQVTRLRTHNQNRTVAARAIADMKTFGHLS